MIFNNINGRKNRKFAEIFSLFGLITVFVFLTLFSQFLHNHGILESEGFDCPLYLFSSQSLMSVIFVFAIFLILVELYRENYKNKSSIQPYFISLPDNKSPPSSPLK